MSRNQPLGPLQGFGVPQQTDLMRQLMEPPAPAKPNVKSALKEFTSDLMFTLSKSLAASAEAPGGRGTALGIAAAIAGPSQRRMLVQQQEDEKAKIAAEAEAAAQRARLLEAQIEQTQTENWKLRNEPTLKYREVIRPDGSKGLEVETPGMQTAPPPAPSLITTTQRIGDQDVEIRTVDQPGAVVRPVPEPPMSVEERRMKEIYLPLVAGRKKKPVESLTVEDMAEADTLMRRAAQDPSGQYIRDAMLEIQKNQQTFQRTQSLRDDYEKRISNDVLRLDAYNNIQAVRDSVASSNVETLGPSDVVLLYNFVKMQDPNAVREGEISLVQGGAPIPDTWKLYVGKYLGKGGVLGPANRRQMLVEADKLANSYTNRVKQVNKEFSSTAGKFDVDPRDFIRPEESLPKAGSAAPQSFVLPNGTTVTLQPDGSYR